MRGGVVDEGWREWGGRHLVELFTSQFPVGIKLLA